MISSLSKSVRVAELASYKIKLRNRNWINHYFCNSLTTNQHLRVNTRAIHNNFKRNQPFSMKMSSNLTGLPQRGEIWTKTWSL